MPKNKRESLIYTVLMCFTMVLWMSVYNVALQHGELSMAVLRNAWLGFPIAYVFAMICDWFLVSGLAKGFAFRFLVIVHVHLCNRICVIIIHHCVFLLIDFCFAVSC